MANRLNYKMLARLEGWPTLSCHPQLFSILNTLRAFQKIHVPSGTVHSSCTDQTKATAVILLVSRIQISGPGENNFVKWKGAFRSDRPDQMRSVSVKGSHSQGETIRACAKAGWGQCLFFLSAGRVTLLQRDRFSPYKENQNFRIRNCDREGIRKKFKILEKTNFEALVISIEKNTQVALWMTEQFL